MTQLDVKWRIRLEYAALHYAEAKKAVIRAAEYAQSVPTWDGTCDIQRTMEAERAALREYSQVLAIFTRLVLDGKTPAEDHEGEWHYPSEVSQDSASSHT
uniref:Uncharacterized protein n=1 Tax=Solibacter usitatus (strain Ellin6076) TaxID=234267 RepID=Q01ZF2_SOLUE